MTLSTIASATTTAGAIAMGALAPAAPAHTDGAYSGSAWGLYSFLATNVMNGLDQINGGPDTHPTENSAP